MLWVAGLAVLPCLAAIQIVEHPAQLVTVREGEQLLLNCVADTAWRWCYWQVSNTSQFHFLIRRTW